MVRAPPCHGGGRGFPIDLTVEMAEEAGMTVDQEGFKALMEEQKVRARKAREALGDLGWQGGKRTGPRRRSLNRKGKIHFTMKNLQ